MNNMKTKRFLAVVAAVAAVVVVAVFAIRRINRREPMIVQGMVECTTYNASSKIPGRIDSMLVGEGANVVRGELLYILSTPELDAKLMQAEAVRSAAAALDAATLAGARAQQREEARAMVQRAEAGLELARKSLERVRRLYDEGVVPAQKLDEAEAQFGSMTATVDAARAQYELAQEGARSEDRQAAAAKLRQAEGALDEVVSYLDDARVYAPVSGEVSSVMAREGELVGSGYPVVTIVDMSEIWAVFNIREDLLPRIRIGTRMTAEVPALGHGVELEVYYIAAEADFATWSATRTRGGFDIRTFSIKARPVGDGSGLRPGMSVLVNWDTI